MSMELVTSIIALLVGAAVFIVGMKLMSSGLKKSTGKGVKRLFKKTQHNPFAGMGIGAAVTALIQSSAATSVMAIGFIATSAMTVYQGVSVILGAYIGTTVTGLLAALSSFNFSSYFVLLAVLGVIMMFFKNDKVKNIGEILTGLGLLFFGLSTMSNAIKGSGESHELLDILGNIFTAVNFPLLLLLIGALFTVLTQSSSATSGIVIVMVGSGAITLESGFYLVLGATIGTVITTMIAAIGGNADVKRTAWMCLAIRVLTALIAMAIVWPLGKYIAQGLTYVFSTVELALAMFLVIYNVVFMFAVVPFIKPIEKLFNKIIKDKDAEKIQQTLKYIANKRLLNTPEAALMAAKSEILDMFDLAIENFDRGYKQMVYQDMANSKQLVEQEDVIDFKNNAITQYLIELTNRVDDEDKQIVGIYFHVINDIERIGDHAYNFHEKSLKMNEEDLHFSKTAQGEFDQMYDAIEEMIKIAKESLIENKSYNTNHLEALEEKMDKLKAACSTAHYNRIVTKTCHMELSPFYSTFVSELERVADHLMNIGYSFINPTGDEIIK